MPTKQTILPCTVSVRARGEETAVGTGNSVQRPIGHRRRVAGGGAMLLTFAALFPLNASAESQASSKPASVTTAAGVVTNITKALTGSPLLRGDYVSSGWAISMTSKHAATAVTISNLVATIPLQCQVEDHSPTSANLVINLPATSVSIPANDTGWHPTSGAATASGYEASTILGDLCRRGNLSPNGKAVYSAKLVSTNTTDVFAVRFHSVDARANQSQKNPTNTNCASTSDNRAGVSPCTAAWTPNTTSLAVAPAPTSGGGTGPVASSVGAVITPLPVLGHVAKNVRRHQSNTSSPATAGTPSPLGGVKAATTQPAPLLVLPPPPSQSTVLGPVPLPVPVIDSVAAGVGGGLPWRWFALLAILDLGLIVGIVMRRRLAHQRDLNAH